MTDSAPRVLVDLSHLHPNGLSGGIKPALLEMLRWLAGRGDHPIRFIHVVAPGLEAEVAALARDEDRVLTADRLPRDLAARELCDVVYCPFGSTALACPGIPTVTLVVDLLHRDFPSSIIPDEQAMRENWFQEAMARTDRFQVISDYTAGRLVHHYGISSDRMFRTYLPLHQRLSDYISDSAADRPAPFFYYPANGWTHKNHATLLHAYEEYLREEGSRAWRLVLTGAADARMEKIKKLAAELGLGAQVCILGYVSESRLAELWRDAGALVFPSLHEGFGIPLLEAMAHGVPIVASAATAIPEVTGQAALLVDARDPAALAAALKRIASDGALRRTLTARGYERARQFSLDWEFGLLQAALLGAAQLSARWRQAGFHPVDGLTDPEAIFALPPSHGSGTVRITTRPLPADRSMQVWCGPDLIGETFMPAGQPGSAAFTFTPRSRAITLRIPNAQPLCATDPRVHGVLLESLTWQSGETGADLLWN